MGSRLCAGGGEGMPSIVTAPSPPGRSRRPGLDKPAGAGVAVPKPLSSASGLGGPEQKTPLSVLINSRAGG